MLDDFLDAKADQWRRIGSDRFDRPILALPGRRKTVVALLLEKETNGSQQAGVTQPPWMKTIVRLSISGLRVLSVVVGAGDGLELESQIADSREQAVQLRLVSDVANQFGCPGAWHRRHALERASKAVAQSAAHLDANAAHHVHGADHHADLRDRTSRTAEFTQAIALFSGRATVAACHAAEWVGEAW